MSINTSSEVSPSAAAAGLPAAPSRRIAGLPLPLAVLIGGAALFAAVHPFDRALAHFIGQWPVTGDLMREWQAWQQFGQGSAIIVLAVVVFQLDRARHRRERLIDFALALGLVGIAVTAMKWLIGRPRPKYDDPHTFLFPWGTYPITSSDGTTVHAHAWDFSVPTHAELWSMPSSHTAFATVMALFISVMYPRLRWLAAGLALVVAGGRLVFDAHWVSDIVAGATVALAIGIPALHGQWGLRLAIRVRAMIKRSAGTPAAS